MVTIQYFSIFRRHEYGRCSTKVITGADDKESIKLNRFAPTNLCIVNTVKEM